MIGKTIILSHISYGAVLRDISFTWMQGETLALMGANGAGKSTLTKIIAGLLRPSSGEIQLWAEEVRIGLNPARHWREVGFVGQHPRRQVIGATVAEELSFGLFNLGLPVEKVKVRVQELLTSLGLQGKEDQSPARLSGGERQRLVTAAVLAMQPPFVILDEALTMLDAHAEARILTLLEEQREAVGQLWITHDPELAGRADRLLLLKDGSLRDAGRPQNLLEQAERRREYGIRPSFRTDLPSQQPDCPPQGERTVLNWEKAVYDGRLSLDTSVREKEFIGILGASGAGKSTLLESAAGLLKPTEGLCFACGTGMNKTHPESLRRENRLLLQEAGEYLIGNTVLEEIFFAEDLLKDREPFHKAWRIIGRRHGREAVLKQGSQETDYLERFGLRPEVAEKHPEELSGGERQKVALAAALRSAPTVLLLDEPALGLDAFGRETLTQVISELCMRTTILYAAHDLREVLPFASRLWLVQAGELTLDCRAADWPNYLQIFRQAGVRCPA